VEDIRTRLIDILADVTGINGDVMRGTDGAALAASWTAGLATILGNFSALRIGYLDQLDFALQEAIAALQTDLDTPNQYKADVSALALEATSTTIKNKTDTIQTAARAGATHDVTTANDKAETQVVEINLAYIFDLAFTFDLDALEAAGEGGIVTVRFYTKPDGANYADQPLHELEYVVGVDPVYPAFGATVHDICKVTIQCSADVTVTQTIAYEYVTDKVGS